MVSEKIADLVRSMDKMSSDFYLVVGFSTAAGWAYFFSIMGNILFTFVLGFMGAIGAAVAKAAVHKMRVYIRKRSDKEQKELRDQKDQEVL